MRRICPSPHTLTLTHSLSLSLSHSLTLTHSHSLSLTLTHSHTLCLTCAGCASSCAWVALLPTKSSKLSAWCFVHYLLSKSLSFCFFFFCFGDKRQPQKIQKRAQAIAAHSSILSFVQQVIQPFPFALHLHLLHLPAVHLFFFVRVCVSWLSFSCHPFVSFLLGSKNGNKANVPVHHAARQRKHCHRVLWIWHQQHPVPAWHLSARAVSAGQKIRLDPSHYC